MRRARASALAIVMTGLLAAGGATPAPLASFKLWGMAYGAFRDGQSPGAVYPSKANIVEDMKILKNFTRRIRTYSVNDTEQLIPMLARKAGIETYAGAHVGSDDAANLKEIESLIEACDSKSCAGLVVGNEVLLHESLGVDDLIDPSEQLFNHLGF